MTKKSKIAALILGACMALSVVCFTACEGTPGKSAYEIWLEQGNTGTEQDFLDSLKGNDGTTPEITVGGNGNWFINGVDTHQKAQGADGTTPEITVGGNGNWFINGVDTHQKAQGADGTTPEITVGGNGNWFVNGVDTHQKAQGESGSPGTAGNKIYHGKGDPKSLDLAAEEGDMYVDTKGWHVYFYESGEWKDYGAISGEAKPEEKVIKEFKAQKLSSAEKFTADLAEVGNGEYYVVVDTGSEATVNTVVANFTTGKAQFFKADMYMPESKEYRCFFNYNGNPITGLDITTTSVEEITADIKIVEYKAPQVALDTPTEVSMNHISHGYAQIKVASELANQEVAIEIDLPTTITKAPTIYNSTLTSNKPTKIKDMNSLGTQDKYYAQITVPEDCIIYIGDGLSTLYCYNGILTITAVS